jgi:hypothetical protein
MNAMYWDPIENTNTVRRPLVTSRHDLKGIEPWDLRRGRRLDRWDEAAWVQALGGGRGATPDDVLQHHLGLGIPICSPRLRAALDAAGIAGIQCLPIEVRRADGSTVATFFVANILNLVAALDVERSAVTYFGPERPDRAGEIKSIERPVLRCAAVEGYDVLRLAEYPLALVVSDAFKRAFEDARCTGYSFEALDLA